MKLFNLFRRNKPSKINENNHDNGQNDISRNLFIEERDPLENAEMIMPPGSAGKGIDEIYAFLQEDYELRGYNDALTNPDESYRTDNINLLKFDLNIVIQKVTTYYEDMLKELDFHISSRGRAGLIDLVDVLKTRKG